MLKKKLTALTLTAMMVGALAGCGSGEGTDSANSEAKAEAAASSKKIVIRYWYAYGDKIEEAKQHMVKTFNESQDKYEVVAEH
ncbi:hypothetical protein [Paenibacillus dokdonensis]|uniref:hypothetical protein n=1 Tax=Paenibacillus dokdonensis TaxID=2567944 RepID=UPI001FEC5974|nr:hypothetical protein [Paenibacillus dokdonensis]